MAAAEMKAGQSGASPEAKSYEQRRLIAFIRHPESDSNKELCKDNSHRYSASDRVFTSRVPHLDFDPVITGHGLQQAKDSAEFIVTTIPSHLEITIVSSPQRRCLQMVNEWVRVLKRENRNFGPKVHVVPLSFEKQGLKFTEATINQQLPTIRDNLEGLECLSEDLIEVLDDKADLDTVWWPYAKGHKEKTTEFVDRAKRFRRDIIRDFAKPDPEKCITLIACHSLFRLAVIFDSDPDGMPVIDETPNVRFDIFDCRPRADGKFGGLVFHRMNCGTPTSSICTGHQLPWFEL